MPAESFARRGGGEYQEAQDLVGFPSGGDGKPLRTWQPSGRCCDYPIETEEGDGGSRENEEDVTGGGCHWSCDTEPWSRVSLTRGDGETCAQQSPLKDVGRELTAPRSPAKAAILSLADSWHLCMATETAVASHKRVTLCPVAGLRTGGWIGLVRGPRHWCCRSINVSHRLILSNFQVIQ